MPLIWLFQDDRKQAFFPKNAAADNHINTLTLPPTVKKASAGNMLVGGASGSDSGWSSGCNSIVPV
jgi:hypothetical protein